MVSWLRCMEENFWRRNWIWYVWLYGELAEMTSSKERFRVNVANYDRLDTEMIRSGRTTQNISNPEIREKRRAEGKGEELSRLYAETHSVQLLGKFRFVRIGLSLIIGFLVACYATLQPALSVRPSVRRSVGPSIRRSVTLYLFGVNGGFGLIAPAQKFHWPQLWPLPTRTRLG